MRKKMVAHHGLCRWYGSVTTACLFVPITMESLSSRWQLSAEPGSLSHDGLRRPAAACRDDVAGICTGHRPHSRLFSSSSSSPLSSSIPIYHQLPACNLESEKYCRTHVSVILCVPRHEYAYQPDARPQTTQTNVTNLRWGTHNTDKCYQSALGKTQHRQMLPVCDGEDTALTNVTSLL